MGKRKSSRKAVKKAKIVLDTAFSCLFCNHERSVTATLDKNIGVGTLTCKVCGQNFQASINALSEPIDVYSEWVDACEAVAKRLEAGENPEEGPDEYGEEAHARSPARAGRPALSDDDDDDGLFD